VDLAGEFPLYLVDSFPPPSSPSSRRFCHPRDLFLDCLAFRGPRDCMHRPLFFPFLLTPLPVSVYPAASPPPTLTSLPPRRNQSLLPNPSDFSAHFFNAKPCLIRLTRSSRHALGRDGPVSVVKPTRLYFETGTFFPFFPF